MMRAYASMHYSNAYYVSCSRLMLVPRFAHRVSPSSRTLPPSSLKGRFVRIVIVGFNGFRLFRENGASILEFMNL